MNNTYANKQRTEMTAQELIEELIGKLRIVEEKAADFSRKLTQAEDQRDAANEDAQTLYNMLRDVGLAAHTARCKAAIREGNPCVCGVDEDLAAHQARIEVKHAN